MLVGYDAKRAFRNNTGLGNYSRSLISQVVKQSSNRAKTRHARAQQVGRDVASLG